MRSGHRTGCAPVMGAQFTPGSWRRLEQPLQFVVEFGFPRGLMRQARCVQFLLQVMVDIKLHLIKISLEIGGRKNVAGVTGDPELDDQQRTNAHHERIVLDIVVIQVPIAALHALA